MRLWLVVCCLLVPPVLEADIVLRAGMPEFNPARVPPLTEKIPDADRLEAPVAFGPEATYRWVESPGRPFTGVLKSAPGGNAEGIVLTLWDWENRPVAQRQFPVPCEEKVSLNVEGRGTFVATLDGSAGKTWVFRLVRSFSVCPSNIERRKAWEANQFWIGQCSFPGWHHAVLGGHPAHPPGLTVEQSRELDAELVARMGVQIARINYPVSRKDDGGLDLDFTLADKCIAAYTKYDLPLDLMILAPEGAGRGPILEKYAAVPQEKAYLHPLREKPYRHFVREVARRYGQHAKFFQVWNEPGNSFQYMGSADDYIATVKQADDELGHVLPEALVTNGGYCSTNEDTRKIIGGIQGVTDFVSYHWHGDLAGLKNFHAEFVKLHGEAGYKKPTFANTEMGLGMSSVGDETRNAQAEVQKILYCWAHDHRGVLLYSSREIWWPRQYSEPAPDYGFVDYFYCPRFVYGAVSAFIDHYAGARFERIIAESDNIHAYQFRRGEDILIAVFAVKTPQAVRLKSDARAGSVIDAMGNETALSSTTAVTLQAGAYPLTVVFQSAKTATLTD